MRALKDYHMEKDCSTEQVVSIARRRPNHVLIPIFLFIHSTENRKQNTHHAHAFQADKL